MHSVYPPGAVVPAHGPARDPRAPSARPATPTDRTALGVSQEARPWRRRFVCMSGELARIKAIPRRTWTDAALVDLAREMTDVLRTRAGSMALRPVQALALHDLGET